jgi:hypothetical protein
MAPSARSVEASKYLRSSAAQHNQVPFSTKSLKGYYWPPMSRDEPRIGLPGYFMGTPPDYEFMAQKS